MRWVVLVDVSNIYYGLRDSRAGARLNYQKLMEWLRRQGEIVAAVAFTAYDPARPEQEEFRTALSHIGFRVVERPIRRENGRPSGNMDVAIAIEAIRLAPLADGVVLGSGDGDFVPLVEALAAQGKIVWVLAPRFSLSGDLARAAHRVILLEDLEQEVPGLIEADRGMAPAVLPALTEEAGPMERLVLRIARRLPGLVPRPPAPFQLSRLGDVDGELAREARRMGGLPALAALALRLHLPGWGLGEREAGTLLVLPAGVRPPAGLRPLSLPDLIRSGLEGLPPYALARHVLEELTRMPPPLPESRRALLDALTARLAGRVSRGAADAVLDALTTAGVLRETPEGGVAWPRDREALEAALRSVGEGRVRKALEGESPAFRERVRAAIGIREAA